MSEWFPALQFDHSLIYQKSKILISKLLYILVLANHQREWNLDQSRKTLTKLGVNNRYHVYFAYQFEFYIQTQVINLSKMEVKYGLTSK